MEPDDEYPREPGCLSQIVVACIASLTTLWALVDLTMLGRDGHFHYYTGVDWAGASLLNGAALFIDVVSIAVCRRWLRAWACLIALFGTYCVWQDRVWSLTHLGR